MSDVSIRSTAQPSRVRPALQERSRVAWEKVLEAGIFLLEERGRESLSIAAVCERAGVSPTAIYRRVDGLAGLFWAIYERAGVRIQETLKRKLQEAEAEPSGSQRRIHAVVLAIASTFEENKKFLHQIVNYSTMDSEMNHRGARESQESVRSMALLLPHPDNEAATDIARYLHQECTFRAMYGEHWLTDQPELFESFLARLNRIAEARLLGSKPDL